MKQVFSLNIIGQKQLITFIVVLLLLGACGNRHLTQYKPLFKVDGMQYCQAESVGQAQSLTAQELKILNDDDRVSDQITIDLMLKKAAYEVVEAADSVADCEQTFTQGRNLFEQKISAIQQEISNKGGFKPSENENIYQVQREITDLWREDQSARSATIYLRAGEQKDAAFWANRLATAQTILADDASTNYIEKIIQSYDWIDQQRFGNSVSAHAWILIQHADDRVDLQAKVLERMKPYFDNGGVRPANYAYLWDRVAVNTDQLQRYGTQPTWECKEGQLELQPIESMSAANKLRSELGMNSVEAGLAEMSLSVCGLQSR